MLSSESETTEKLYYTIGEVSEMFDVNASLIRFWEKEFDMLKPKKKCNLNNIVSYINSNAFKDNFMFSGRFKIGHRQICNSYLPSEYL